jgi:5'-3' exonuclease
MNIVIDGNAFLNVVTSVVKNILAQDLNPGTRGSKSWAIAVDNYYVKDLLSDETFILKEYSKETFKKFTLNYLGSIFAPFKENISSVFIVFDSKSWRRQFIKDHFAEHGEGDFAYKGNREYDDHSHLFFDYFQFEMLPILTEDYGILSNRVHGAEGDDLIAYICEHLREDICIWSVDKDLTQLLESGDRKVIMIMPKMQTKFKKIFTTENFDMIEEKEIDLLNFDIENVDNSAIINVLNDLINTKGYHHLKIDPTFDILTKIIAGDSSDTIPRVHIRLTPGKVTKVIESIRETIDWTEIKNQIDRDDPEFMSFLLKVICEIIKVNEPDETLTIQNNLKRNRTLIRLNTVVFPESLLKSITDSMKLEDRRKFNYFKFKKNHKS